MGKCATGKNGPSELDAQKDCPGVVPFDIGKSLRLTGGSDHVADEKHVVLEYLFRRGQALHQAKGCVRNLRSCCTSSIRVVLLGGYDWVARQLDIRASLL